MTNPKKASRTQPTSSVLEMLAKLPEDVQKMALGFAYGLDTRTKEE